MTSEETSRRKSPVRKCGELRQGIDKFAKPYDALIGSLETARRSALAMRSVGADQRLERGA
jgi:hypothetical protein